MQYCKRNSLLLSRALCKWKRTKWKKKTKNQNQNIETCLSHRQNSKIDNENTKLLDASLLQTM